MEVLLESFLFNIGVLLAITFTGLAQSANPPVAIAISAPQTVKVGSKIIMDVTLKNISNRVVTGYFEDVSHGELNFDFGVRDSEGKLVPETCYMKAVEGLDRGSCQDFIVRTHKGTGEDSVKPGETIKGSAELSELYDLKPGTYVVQLSWWENYTRYRDPQKPRPPSGTVVAKSNIINVTITN